MPTNREETPNTPEPVGDRPRTATDDERPDGQDGPAFETYDDEYGYRLAYPADWLAEREPAGGASFDDSRGSPGASASVNNGVDCTLTAYVAAFLDADDHVRALEALDRREVALEGGAIGRVVEYAYRSDSGRWRLTYLFALADGTGYVLGVDWNDEDTSVIWRRGSSSRSPSKRTENGAS